MTKRASEVQANQESAETAGTINANSINSFLTQNGRDGQNQSIPDLAHSHVSMETLEKQIEEIDRELSRFDLPVNEEHEQSIGPGNSSLQYTPPYTTTSTLSPSFIPSPSQNSNYIVESQQHPNPIPPSLTTSKNPKNNMTLPSPKKSMSPKNNPAFPNPDVPHINTHPIITRTLSPPQLPKPTSPPHHSTKNPSISSSQNRAHDNTPHMAPPSNSPIITRTLSPPQLPNHYSTPHQLPKSTSPPHHTTKIPFVSSSQNRAHGNTPSLATWKRIPRLVSQEAVFKSEPLGQK